MENNIRVRILVKSIPTGFTDVEDIQRIIHQEFDALRSIDGEAYIFFIGLHKVITLPKACVEVTYMIHRMINVESKMTRYLIDLEKISWLGNIENKYLGKECHTFMVRIDGETRRLKFESREQAQKQHDNLRYFWNQYMNRQTRKW